jgi:carbonic anhydrase
MKTITFPLPRVVLAVLLGASCVGPAIADVSPDDAIRRLTEGNQRFVSGRAEHPGQDADRRTALLPGQNPFAVILACADSRVPPEILFDQGLGDLFVVRVAGNVAGIEQTGSCEYGVEHLGVRLLVVLGHGSCGAVSAVVQGAEMHGNIPAAVARVVPAVTKARVENVGGPVNQVLAGAIRLNVLQAMEDMFHASPIIRDLVRQGRLQVIGATYDLSHGTVEWLGFHPEQERLLAATGGPAPHHRPDHIPGHDPGNAAAADPAKE